MAGSIVSLVGRKLFRPRGVGEMKKPTKSAALPSVSLCITGIFFLALVPTSGQSRRSFSTPAAETFDGGYRTVEGMQSFLDAEVASIPRWPKRLILAICGVRPTPVIAPTRLPSTGTTCWRFTSPTATCPAPSRVFWFDAGVHADEIAPRRWRCALSPGCWMVTTRMPMHTGWWTTTTSGLCRWQPR